MADSPATDSPRTSLPLRLQPWNADVQDIGREIQTDFTAGLSVAEAANRLDRDGPNELVVAAPFPHGKRY